MNPSNHRDRIAQFMFVLFAALVLVISALTSFSFFFTHFGNLIPVGLIDGTISRIISGLVGMTLFDIATAIWLYTFLHHSETPEQRAVTLIMTVVAFVGASSASVAYLGLNATGDLALDPMTRSTIGIAALVTVIVGIVLNFGAAQAHQRFSLDSKLAVREADRRDAIQAAEDEQAKYLNQLVTKNVKERLTKMAPRLADEQARRLADKFYDREDAKYQRGSKRPPRPSLSKNLNGPPQQQKPKGSRPEPMTELRDGALTGQIEIPKQPEDNRPFITVGDNNKRPS